MTPAEQARFHSYECFMNSMLRECEPHLYAIEEIIKIFTDEGKFLIPVKQWSVFGRLHYDEKKISEVFQSHASLLSYFKEILKFYGDRFLEVNTIDFDPLLYRLNESLKTIEFHLNHSADFLESLGDPSVDVFQETEQGLFYGHNFHPHPKSREGMTLDDFKTYAPEGRGTFALVWCEVDPEILYSDSVDENEKNHYSLLQSQHDLKPSKSLLCFHPFQFEYLKSNHTLFQNYLETNRVRLLTSKPLKWKATTSMRSIYNNQSALMLKFSLSLRLTNSVRVLTKREALRGLQVKRVFSTERAVSLLEKYPDFKILYEPAVRALIDSSGDLIPECIVVSRDNAFIEQSDRGVYSLAVLAQKTPDAKQTVLGKVLKTQAEASQVELKIVALNWYRQFLKKGIEPFLAIQSSLGVWLGAHQQNLILKLSGEGEIEKVFFRDCQGTGYAKWSYDYFVSHQTGLNYENGNILSGEMGNSLFSYYLFINSVLNCISALSFNTGLSEEKLIIETQKFLVEFLESDLPQKTDRTCLNYLLSSHFLWQKGNFLCSLKNLNENTEANPFALYTKMPNLFKTERNSTQAANQIVYQRYLPHLHRTIKFRVASLENDLERFHSWHHQKRVSKFWELEVTKEQHGEYLQKLLDSETQLPLIVEFDDTPVGYIESYWVKEDRLAPYYDCSDFDRGFHFLVGEKQGLGFAYTDALLQSACHFLFLEDHRTQRIMAEPRSDNKLLLRYLERFPSWKKIKEFNFPHKHAALLSCEREGFFRLENLNELKS